MSDEKKTVVDELIEMAGGPVALAKAVGLRYQSIQEWVRRGYVPADRCRAVEARFGIPRERLNPEVYGE